MAYLFFIFFLLSGINCLSIKVGFLSDHPVNYEDLFKQLVDQYSTELGITIEPKNEDVSTRDKYKAAITDLKGEKITTAFGIFEMDDPDWYDEKARDAGIYIFNSKLDYNVSTCLTNIIISRSPCDSDNSGINLFISL